MVWMGGTTEDDDDGYIPVIDAALERETQAAPTFGNTDMMNMRTDQSAMNIMNDPKNLKAHGLAGTQPSNSTTQPTWSHCKQ